MAVANVPWFIGGGAQHSPEVARNMLHIASMRTQGIVGTSDLRVSPLPIPGQGVRVGTGSALVWKDGTPNTQQTYSAYAPSATDVTTAPTGSGGGRSDLVVLRIEDPFNSNGPWQNPTDPTNGPYAYIRVITGVPAGTTTVTQTFRSGDTAIPLARIDFPPATGTVTQAMITDLRQMAAPRQVTYTNFNQNSTVGTLTSDIWTAFPPYAPGNIIPEWATHAQARCWMDGIVAPGPVDGEMRLELWAPNNRNIVYGPICKYDVDVPIAQWGKTPAGTTGGGEVRFSRFLACYGAVHQYRGEFAFFVVGAHRLPNRPDRADIRVDGSTSVAFDITFYEKPI